MQKNIIGLIIINILWGFIPFPAAGLFDKYSIYLVVFTRFLFMGVILLIISIIGMFREKISPRVMFLYLREKNTKFFSLPQWAYLLIVAAFTLNGNVLLFFYGLKTVGAIITAMGFIIALVVISILNWGYHKEEFSSFKFLYLAVLIISLTILAVISNSTEQETSTSFSIDALILVLFYGITLGLFVITTDRDSRTEREVQVRHIHKNYENLRSLFKLSLISLFAVISLFPTLLFIESISSSLSVGGEIRQFFSEVSEGLWWNLAWNWNGIILIIFCTIIPFVAFYRLADSWKGETTFDLWAGVLQILEPIINIILGITLLGEIFPEEWLAVIIILLIIAIITKYISETQANVQAILLIRLTSNIQLEEEKISGKVSNPPRQNTAIKNKDDIIRYFYKIKSIREVSSIIGEYDIMCDISAPTQKYLNMIILNRIPLISRIESYDLEIITKKQKT